MVMKVKSTVFFNSYEVTLLCNISYIAMKTKFKISGKITSVSAKMQNKQ